ncbi:hypothetical protein ACSBR1_011787 [Camellia fascicularis]
MSRSQKPISKLGLNTLPDRFRDSMTFDDDTTTTNKPDFRELDLGSPVSPLTTRRSSGPAASGLTTTTSSTTSTSSSSSSGSVSGRNRSNKASNNHSGELSGSVESSPKSAGGSRCFRTGPGNPDSGNTQPLIYSGGSSVNSPPFNVLPTGNICPSGKILKTGMASRSSKTEVLGSGTVNYGHGSIMRGGTAVKLGGGDGGGGGGANKSRGGDSGRSAMSSFDPEEVKRAGNEQYKVGNLGEALSLYDRAIAILPGNATYRFNKAVALTGLRRLAEAVREFEEAIRLDPRYVKAHHRLGSLLLRLGQVENARRHLCFPGYQPDANELQRLQEVEMHLSKCTDARKICDWKSALREGDATIAAGADASPQSKFFGMLSEAYLFFVQAQIDMAFGRFENAVTAAEKAGQIDPQNIEISVLLNNVRLVSRARVRGNDLFKSERFTEACSAYGEGLRLDPSNSVLYCNRAACWYKLGLWERAVDDCNQALHFQPNYTKALLRRAASNNKLERWAEAVRDYEVLRRVLPNDNEVAESMFYAQVALKKSRGEDISNMKFGGEVELVSGLEQFRAAISSPGASVVHFKAASNLQCKEISPFIDTLCGRYPSINFFMVDVEESMAVAVAEKVRIVPTFKIYKNGSRVKEIVCPSPEVLESSVRHYSF